VALTLAGTAVIGASALRCVGAHVVIDARADRPVERAYNGHLGLRDAVTETGQSASRWSWRARLGTTKDARKIGRKLFPVHRKATV
jgi:hypothetical protein